MLMIFPWLRLERMANSRFFLFSSLVRKNYELVVDMEVGDESKSVGSGWWDRERSE